MLITEVRKNLADVSRKICDKGDILLSLETSYATTSDWVTPVVQRLAARTGKPVVDIEHELRQRCQMPNGVRISIAPDGLMHLSASNESLMAACKYFDIHESTGKFQGTALSIKSPSLKRLDRTDFQRARLWSELFEGHAKSQGVSINRAEDDGKPQITLRGEGFESRHLFQTLEVSDFHESVPPEFVKAARYFHSGLERTGRPAHVAGGMFISLQEPLFKVFYAEHLVATVMQQSKDLEINTHVREDSSIFEREEPRQIMRIALLWPMLAEHAYRDADLRPLFLHAISLAEWVIKWYNAECLWDASRPNAVKGQKEVLNVAALVLGYVLKWVKCPRADFW